MRFTLIKNLEKDGAMRPILSGLLIFMFLYLVVDIFVKEANFGLFTESVASTLFGDEEEYLDPISKASFLEFIHTEIFFIMMILLTLSAVFVRLCSKSKVNLLLLNVVMVFALASLISLGGAYFYSSLFISFYVWSFFIWHIGAFYMIVYSLWKLYAKRV